MLLLQMLAEMRELRQTLNSTYAAIGTVGETSNKVCYSSLGASVGATLDIELPGLFWAVYVSLPYHHTWWTSWINVNVLGPTPQNIRRFKKGNRFSRIVRVFCTNK